MNKTEKLICLVLGAVLAWYIFIEMPKQSQAAADAAKAQAVQAAQATGDGAVALVADRFFGKRDTSAAGGGAAEGLENLDFTAR